MKGRLGEELVIYYYGKHLMNEPTMVTKLSDITTTVEKTLILAQSSFGEQAPVLVDTYSLPAQLPVLIGDNQVRRAAGQDLPIKVLVFGEHRWVVAKLNTEFINYTVANFDEDVTYIVNFVQNAADTYSQW